MFGLVERFIGAKIVEVTRDHATGDQVAMEALVRFTDEELKHQELFRRLDALAAAGMPAGYRFVPEPNAVASFVLGKGTWAVLALTCDIELFTQAHYRASIAPDSTICPLWRDVFLFHWKEESQHAILDELEWRRIDASLTAAERDRGVTELLELVAGVDGLLQAQAAADTAYFVAAAGPAFTAVPGGRDRRHLPGRLPLAVHRVGRGRPALPGDPGRDADARPARPPGHRPRCRSRLTPEKVPDT